MTVQEGSGYSRGPCAKVLSVAGLFALIGTFPGSGGLFPEVKEASFLGRKPCTVDVTNRTAFSPGLLSTRCHTGGYTGGCVQGGTPSRV